MRGSLVFAGADVLVGDPPAFVARDVVVSDGVITAMTPHGGLPHPDATEVVDVRHRALLPGFINAHTHAYGQVCRCVPRTRLEPWLPLASAAAATMGPDAHAVAAQLNVLDNLRHGVTTSLDHATLSPAALDATAAAYEQTGGRIVLAAQTSDLGPESFLAEPRRRAVFRGGALAPPNALSTRAEAVAITNALLDRAAASPLITGAVGPSAPERCTEELLAALGSMAAEREVLVHTHLLETVLQREHVDPLGRLQRNGLLHRRTTVAHAIHLDPVDRERLSTAQATVVHDPLCNLLFGSGEADTAELLRAGVAVALGTDGWPTGGAQDIIGQARLALALRRPTTPPEHWLDPRAVWRMLTAGGARAVGHEGRLGTLEVGAFADLLVVDPARAGWLPSGEPAEQIVLAGLGAGLRRVYVGGCELWRDGSATTVEEERLRFEADRHARRCNLPDTTAAAHAQRISELFMTIDDGGSG